MLNFYQNPDQSNDIATLNDNEGIDGGEIIFPSNNHHLLIKDQHVVDGKLVKNNPDVSFSFFELTTLCYRAK